jgi:MarR family transcriptional regulator, organic hydroperoxide resistance regulator
MSKDGRMADRGRARPAGTKAKLPLSVSLPPLLSEGTDGEFRRLIYRMLIAEARLVDIRKAIGRQVGVSGAQYTIMMAILHLEGDTGVSVSGLAAYLEVTGPHITGEVGQLTARGLVRKAANPNDMRGVQLRLSAEGRRRLLGAFAFIRQANDILFDGVSRDEFRALSAFHEKFIGNTARALQWTRQSSRRGHVSAA